MTELERTNDQGHFLHSCSSLMHEMSITQFILDPQNEVPFKYSPSVCPFASFSVCQYVWSFSQESLEGIF